MTANETKDLYRIGTVASLTGISIERLRAWERRYNLSPAHKAGKTRYYSGSQLEKLKLIKHLIDQGQPISSLANLSLEQLSTRIDAAAKVVPLAGIHQPSVGLIGPNLNELEQQMPGSKSQARINVISRWANIEAFAEEQTGTDKPEVILAQLPVLSNQPIDFIKEIYPESKLVVVYNFATAAVISQIQSAGIPTAKWPVSWSEIEHLALTEAGLPMRAPRAVPRRYSDEELIAIAANSDDPTNCPGYLVEQIHQLNALSAFTEDCSLTVDQPDLYERVSVDVTQARAQLELALESLIDDATVVQI